MNVDWLFVICPSDWASGHVEPELSRKPEEGCLTIVTDEYMQKNPVRWQTVFCNNKAAVICQKPQPGQS